MADSIGFDCVPLVDLEYCLLQKYQEDDLIDFVQFIKKHHALIEYIFNASKKLDMSPATKYIATRIFYKYIQAKKRINAKLQSKETVPIGLRILSCLQIASKVNETPGIAFSVMRKVVTSHFSAQELEMSELEVLNTLEFQVFCHYELWHFVELYLAGFWTLIEPKFHCSTQTLLQKCDVMISLLYKFSDKLLVHRNVGLLSSAIIISSLCLLTGRSSATLAACTWLVEITKCKEELIQLASNDLLDTIIEKENVSEEMKFPNLQSFKSK